jgi:quercetin dioxygenase-like cupin family protein
MHGGTSISPHRADGPITVHGIEGTVDINTEAQKVSVRPGQLVMLHAGVYHSVEAPQDCAFLLTLSADSSHRLG